VRSHHHTNKTTPNYNRSQRVLGRRGNSPSTTDADNANAACSRCRFTLLRSLCSQPRTPAARWLRQRSHLALTLSTLRTMAETYFSREEPPTPAEAEQAATRMSQLYEMLVEVRPELGPLSLDRRVEVRRELLVDQAVMMHGYAELMRRYMQDYERVAPRSSRPAR
jgi:hypothetical protein